MAFKTVVFMPMAISAFAAGITWRIMYEQDPDRGAVNAGIAAVRDAVAPAGVLADAAASTDSLQGTPKTGLELAEPVAAGDVAQLGLTRIPNDELPIGRCTGGRP